MFKLFRKIKEDKVLASHKVDVQVHNNLTHDKFIRDMLPSSMAQLQHCCHHTALTICFRTPE